jgi:hypothetical protein
MPKRYRIDMTITNEETDTQVDSDSHVERLKDDTDAKEKFQLKTEAARKEGKGSE